MKPTQNNFIDGSTRGIALHDVVDSQIVGNHIRDNLFGGINLSSGPLGGAVDNLIRDNITSGNGDGFFTFDLTHDVNSTPNTWTGNSCDSKSGSDIPNC